jgi:carbamoyltransferase
MTGPAFDELFGGPPRRPESAIEQRHMDLAASIQAVTEELMMAMARDIHRETGMRNLVLAGGVALNCVANGKLLRDGPFDDIWIQPAAGDAGGALGAALITWYQLLENPRQATGRDTQKGSLLGPRFSAAEICDFLDGLGVTYHRMSSERELLEEVVDLLADDKVVGWFQGRMEFGPRELCARSIIGDARSTRMQTTMNLKIKFRESFRPFAPIVLQSEAHRWFQMEPEQESPYMLLVAPVRDEHWVAIDEQTQAQMMTDPDLRNRVNVPRSTIPAVTHVDYSARVQTVDAERNPRMTRLLEAFHQRTGCPVLVNTSFNVRGEPIVCTPEDAFRCFMGTEMDVLVCGRAVMEKGRQQASLAQDYKDRFEAD